MEILSGFSGMAKGYVVGLASLLLLFMVIELVFPHAEEQAPSSARLKGVLFAAVYAPFAFVTTLVLSAIWHAIGVTPLLPDLAPPGLPRPVGVIVAALAAAFIGDFFYYWAHRAQHRFFWRFHAVHHSVRRMSGAAAYHHVTETFFKIVLYAAPLSLLTQDPYGMPVIGALISLQGNYLHSPTRLHFGPLGRYLVDNRFHRIHHAIEPQLHDKNFGVFTTLWDSLFGTAYFPAKDEWPATGVADFPEPAGVVDYLTAPFTWRAGPGVEAPALGEAANPTA